MAVSMVTMLILALFDNNSKLQITLLLNTVGTYLMAQIEAIAMLVAKSEL